MPTEPITLDALGPAGEYRTKQRLRVDYLTGGTAAELSIVPKVYVSRAMAALHKATSLPEQERLAALAKAGEIFVNETIAGLSFSEYEHTVTRTSGVPISVVRQATAAIAESAASVADTAPLARPQGAVGSWRDSRTRGGRAIWTRRGDVFAVHAAGNHPGPHSLWLEALALGYRVAIRPSRREPFTPHRLVTALRAAGFGNDQVVLLPTEYDAADEILRRADLGMVYGGDDVVRKYGGDTTILPQGPGRSKILVTADSDWRQHLDTIVDSISDQGGVACINATAVLVEGDPAPLAEALAERLAAIPSLPVDDERAILSAHPPSTAQAMQEYLAAQARESTAWLGGEGIVEHLDDGTAVLRPAVHQLDRADAPQAGIELPFPCVWVAPWNRQDGTAPLRESLVLTAITGDDQLVDELVAEPTVSNVYLGDYPTHWIRPGIPHDSYLGEFLMRTKAVARA
ncbi:aldehyde dehydrogenase family protein [Actinopolyspora mortivallis]|uniref:aldehyde dehydrogenase family protein n=1 Tax=Actinopolyspora mortivallis TaxID=33906 RepID=UPI00037D7518|nr:aldehyde dehydrogenase family protein [Actinopolyspora mortivallis]